jgi:hypothetical protein
MHNRAAVFVGAGLTDADYRDIDTDTIDLFPPIRRGDLGRATADGYDVIAIIDGEFYHTLAVSPKEILVALRYGRRVLGGSSMGALRAAEMDVLGMEGVGQIYNWYRRGVVTRDDDVALMFGLLDDHSYRATTVPMVNVLWATREFKRHNMLTSTVRRRLTIAARRIHWANRNWFNVCEAAGLTDADRQTVWNWARDPDNDLKRLDSKRVIERTVAAVQQRSPAPVAHGEGI